MNSKKYRMKSEARNLLSVYVSCPSTHMPEIHSRRQPVASLPKRSFKQLIPHELDNYYDVPFKNQLHSHTYILKNGLNQSKFQKIQAFKSEIGRTKRSHIQKRAPYIKPALSPYLEGTQPGYLKHMAQKNKPVLGPTDSIKKSIYKYKQSNLDNVQVVLNNRKIENFNQKMEEFAMRSGFPVGSKFFISNSKDCFIKQELMTLGWIQNKVRESKYFHLKWVVNDVPSDYSELDYQQKFNHFNNNKELTNKNSLQKNIRKHNKMYESETILIPLSFDIQNQKEKNMFEEEYEKQMVLAILKQFVRVVRQKKAQYFNKLMRDKQLWVQSFKLNKKGKAQHKKQITTLDLYQKQKNTSFMFEIKLLSLCLAYFYNCSGVESNYTMLFPKNNWNNNIFSLSRLSNNISYFELSSILETPSKLLMRQMFKLYIHFSQNQDFYSYGENNIWMAKSVGVSRGNGITILKQKQKLLEAANIQKKFIQKYIQNPLIFKNIKVQHLKFVQGKKFDLRQWVLVKSLVPLEVYKFDKCYVRLCSQTYNKTPNDYTNLKQHLTNYSQNKMHFQKREESVISLQELKLLLPPGIYQSKISPKIDNIIYRTMLACANNMTHNSSCFQLYGFDILISEDYNTWLLEVNLSPACEQRTEWMSRYVKQMAQGLIDVVVDDRYYNQKQDFCNHWKQIEYEPFIEADCNDKYYEENIGEIICIQKFWRMVRKRKQIMEYFNIQV